LLKNQAKIGLFFRDINKNSSIKVRKMIFCLFFKSFALFLHKTIKMVKPTDDFKQKKLDSFSGEPFKRIFFLIMGLLAIVLFVIICMAGKDFIVWRDGKPELADWRKEKLDDEIHRLRNAEQYVLVAGIPGEYPCFNCFGKRKIFLNPNEVWKYGTTTVGREGRYRDGLPHPGLIYIVEFEGPIQLCLEREKVQIYGYATLPENIKRPRHLKRPPGNKRDH
jgi:hypothetical protein